MCENLFETTAVFPISQLQPQHETCVKTPEKETCGHTAVKYLLMRTSEVKTERVSNGTMLNTFYHIIELITSAKPMCNIK